MANAVWDMAAAVEAGSRWLDETRPGWYNSINLDTLDINFRSVCICGQLGLNSWTESEIFMDEERGFCCPSATSLCISDEKLYEMYNELTLLWKDTIRKRLAANRSKRPANSPIEIFSPAQPTVAV